jgi:penicillin amidase
MKYQTDVISPYAVKVTQHILTSFEKTKITDKNLQFALELIEDWNYEMDEFSQVPSIYAYFLKHLMENIYLDELGPDLYNEFVFVGSTAYRSTLKILENGSAWFDNITTRRIETKESIIRKSFADALSSLETKFGPDVSQWQWGKLHRVVIKHQFSGYSPLLDEYINIGPEPISGDGTTIFNTEYPLNEGIKDYSQSELHPFQNNLGPSMRYIYDFSKPDEFYLIMNTGQSGNIFSDHYEDMFRDWLYGRYLKIRTDDKSLKRNKKLLELIPGE